MGVEQRLELIFNLTVRNCPADSLSLFPGNLQEAGSVEQKSLGEGREGQGSNLSLNNLNNAAQPS